MDPIRSALYMPANRRDWVETADEHGADVVILDLEDAVPHGEKDVAREIAAEELPALTDRDQRVHVRINGHPNDSDGLVERDLEAVVCEELEAIVVPEVREPEDIARLDAALTHIERRDDLEPGGVELVVLVETAQAMRQVYELCTAADRVSGVSCGAVKGADTSRALDFEWTGPGREGLETIHLRQSVLVDARAAGVDCPLSGPYVDIEDTEGLREDMRYVRQCGYAGYCVIHPSHVEHANDVFLPDAETVEYWLGAREALIDAREAGKSAVRYDGEMIDTAALPTARRYLDLARAFEDELDLDAPIPDIDDE